MENEIWKDIPGCGGMYQASLFGRIRSLIDGKVRIIGNGFTGRNVMYKNCSINKKCYYVHRIIAQIFIPNPENKPEVDHIDYNSFNNSVSNLRWVDHSENQQHSRERLSLSKQGEKHPRTSLSNEDVRQIINLRNNGARHKEISQKFGITENNSCQICTRTWKNI